MLPLRRRIGGERRADRQVEVGAAGPALVAGDRGKEHQRAIGLHCVGVLVDAAARKQHAAFGRSDFRGELADFFRSDAGERRSPLRRIAALEDEVAPALPAFDPALAERQIVQSFREDLVRQSLIMPKYTGRASAWFSPK